MRHSIAAILVFASVPLMAANMRFEPPNPDSRTPVTAHVLIDPGCATVKGSEVTRDGSVIKIMLLYHSDICITTLPAKLQDFAVNLGVLPPARYDVVVSPHPFNSAAPSAVLPVTEADPSFRIEPNTIDAGSPRTIRLSGQAVLFGNASVKIDGIDAPVMSRGSGVLFVQAPPHTPGVVDVVVEGDAGTFKRTAALNYFALDYDPAFFERVLIPVFYSGPGAFGSQWRTEIGVHNGNDFTLIDGNFSLFRVNCFPVCDPRLAGGDTMVNTGFNISTGVVQFLSRQAMPKLDFSLRVRDLSRDATDLGTSVPVVRESEMFRRRFSLLNVPSDPRYRIGLRLYAYDTIPTRMSVAIATFDGSYAVGNSVTLLPASEHAFVFIGDLLAEYPQLIGKGPLRIDITPFERTQAWGYVSITNNDTQHVTVISPE